MTRFRNSVRILRFSLVLAAGVACGGHAAAPVAAPGAPAPSSERAGGNPRAPSVACGAEPVGLEAILHPGAVIVFGEIHGTAETPAFVANVACHAARPGGEVAVGLEVPRDLQPQVDRFVESSGRPDDAAALVRNDHWKSQDGNASKALLGVIESLRALRRSGRHVRVFLFDMAQTDSGDRDQNMAANIVAQADHNADGVTLVLTGNLHARTDTERWMSWHIARRHPGVVTLNVRHAGGSAYLCLMGRGCGAVTDLPGEDLGKAAFIEVFAAPDDKGYGGRAYLGGPITASPPVIHDGPVKVMSVSRPDD